MAEFACVFIALFVAHSVGDHWVQTSCQSADKGKPGWVGHWACGRHVIWLTVTKVVVLAYVWGALDLNLSTEYVAAGLAIDAITHYWADRRHTLAKLADKLGKTEFYELGSDTATKDGDTAYHIGTGKYALDQSFHHFWLLVSALIIAG